MLEGRFAAVALACVHANQVRYKVFGRLGDVIPIGTIELVFAFHDLREQVVVVAIFVVKRRIAAEKNVGDHANRPNVYRFAVTVSRVSG